MLFRSAKTLYIACCLAGLGCGGSAAPVTRPAPAPRPSCAIPENVQLELEASDRVNLDETGRALPTRLRVYQLSDLTRLQSASFEDLWSRPEATLAQTRVKSEEIVVYPGQVAVHRFNREARADYIVGVAIFREPEGEAWRTAQEWPAPGDPCRATGKAYEVPAKLRVRMFLEDSRIESVTNFAELPKRRCPPGSACATSSAPELRRNLQLRTFEEDSREPEQAPSDP
jgi:type VI secretion system protein VasD